MKKKYQKNKKKKSKFYKKTMTAQKIEKRGAKEEQYLEEHIEKAKVSCVSVCCLVPCLCCSCYPPYLFVTHLSPCYPPYLLSHTWHLEHFRPATRTSTLDYNSALLSVTALCARYTYYSLLAFQAPQILQISTEKGLCNLGTTASQVSRTSRQLYRPLLALVRTL